MRYLLDTNVLSEGSRPRPDQGVLAWIVAQSPLDLAISAVSLGEISDGIERLPQGRRREGLESWLHTALPRQFYGRVLPVDETVAIKWGRLAAEGRMNGRLLPPLDGFLVATAAVHNLMLVTRNERDCAGRGVPILNPWTSNA